MSAPASTAQGLSGTEIGSPIGFRLSWSTTTTVWRVAGDEHTSARDGEPAAGARTLLSTDPPVRGS